MTPSLFDDENFVIMWVIVVVLVRFGNLLSEGEKRDTVEAIKKLPGGGTGPRSLHLLLGEVQKGRSR